MNVIARIQLGLSGVISTIAPMWLDAANVGAAASWSGSYHVLGMDDHYDDYVVTGRIPALPAIAGMPAAHPYERLTGKIRAAGVTGNIGECAAALFARRYIGAAIGDIAHTRPRQPFRRRRAPDYMMRLGALMPGQFATIIPGSFSIAWPDWWPVESKARSSAAAIKTGRGEALRQLVTYWALLAFTQPSAVGFGLIVTLAYRPPREIRASLFLPRNQQSLIAALQAAGEDAPKETVMPNLYGCGN